MSGSESSDKHAEESVETTSGPVQSAETAESPTLSEPAEPAAQAEPAYSALADLIPTTQTPLPLPQSTSTAPLDVARQPGFPQPGYLQPGFTQPVSAQPAIPQPAIPQPTSPQPAYPYPGYAPAAYPQPTYPQPAGYGYPGYQQHAIDIPTADPGALKRKRKRLWIIGAVVVVLGLISAGIYALLPGRTGNSIVSVVTCKSADLTTCLINAPAGAVRLSANGDDQWPQQTVSTAGLYAGNITTDSPGVGSSTTSLLSQDGVKTVAHNDWNAVDGDNIDIVLLRFSTQKGAQAWNSTRAAEILAAYPGSTVAIPGDSTNDAHAATKPDAKGDIDAGYSTVVGQIVLNVSYSSPNRLSAQDLQNWAGTELTSLRTAPAPAADAAPTAPATQQVACGSGLQSCLMATPGDGQAWSNPTDSHWVAGSSLTSAQLVHLFWENASAAVQQQVLTNFNSDGVANIAHEDWTVNNNFEQADLYLIQTITATGASQLNSSNFGEPVWGGGLSGVSYTIPNASNAQAWYTNKTDSSGFIDFAYTTTVGNVIVFGWLYFYGSLDSGTANSWAEPELDRVGGSTQTAPMGLFSLTAPTLPAASPGTCPASGDCLLPLPAGASDTTTSSYQNGESLSAPAYVDQYEAGSSDAITTWLNSDGFFSAEHRSWTASNGATADAVLLKYTTPAQAQAAAMLEYGVNASADRVCTDTAVPDSLCLAAPVSTSDLLQKETIWVLAWKGDYEVSVSVSISNAADLVQAYTWTQQQLDMLPAS